MKKIITLLLIPFLFLSVFAQSPGYVPNEIMVMMKPGHEVEDLVKKLNARGLVGQFQQKEIVSKRYRIYLLQHDAILGLSENVVKDFYQYEEVAVAQVNHYVQHRATTPNDANFGNQWALNNTGGGGGVADADIDAPEAWDVTTGGITTTGDTIVVAVVDGGFQLTHPDLAPNLYRNYGEIGGTPGVDDDGNGYIDDINGWDAYANDGTIPSDNHGTHVSGIVGARGNNSIGVSGVNWNVKIMTIAGSSGTEAVVVRAYGYAADMRERYNNTNGAQGAFVVSTNASFGVDGGAASSFPIWCAFYDTLGAVGILNAGAGPNNNTNIDIDGDIPTTCPSNYMIAVTNTTNTDARNSSCGFGPINMDIGAPGTNIYNTIVTSSYGNLTGTSMATPHVAGAIGLYWAAACQTMVNDYKNNPSALALTMRNYLLTGVDSISSMATTTSSRGRLNLNKGILRVLSYDCDTTNPPTAGFNASVISGCPGFTTTFNNTTVGTVTSYAWSFPGGSPSSSTLENPTVTYSSLGDYNVQLIVTNVYGSDTLLLTNYVSVNNTSVQTIYTEDFEEATMALTGWTVENPVPASSQWSIFNTVGNPGSTRSAGIDIFNNQSFAPTTDGLVSPILDFTEHSSITLEFKHAHRRRVTSIRDSLWVWVSTDGGLTFPNRVLSRAESGAGTFATNSITTSNFVPSAANDWCMIDLTPGCFTVDLSAYDHMSNIRIKFEAQNNGGNNIYIDDVTVRGVCSGDPSAAPVTGFNTNDNSICAGNTVSFINSTSGTGNSYVWTFSGGTPSSSVDTDPIVTYNTPGTYTVQLIATNAFGADTTILTNYVTVFSNPAVPTISESSGVLTSSYATGNQWFFNGNPISGATNNTYTPTNGGSYSVVHTDANGCSSTSSSFISTVGLENELNFNITVFPNPAKSFITIQSSEEGNLSVSIQDLSGRVLQKTNNYSKEQILDISSYSNGVYLISVTINNKTITKKIIKH